MNPPFSLVDRFGSGLTPLAPAEPVGGGFSGATVLKVACRDGAFAVRGWPAAADPGRLRGLHRLLRHVAGQGVPVAVPLVDVTGSTLVRAGDNWWQVEPWLPGRPHSEQPPSDEKLEAAVKALAAFHRAGASFGPTANEDEWFGGPTFAVAPAVRDRLRFTADWIRGDTARVRRELASATGEFAELARQAVREFERVAERVLHELRIAESIRVPLTPVLRDVWREHVLFTEDAVTGLIDASACRRDTVASDLSRLLGSLAGDDARRWDLAVAAYARERPLAVDEAALVPILDRSGVVLSAMTWVRRRYLLGQACETEGVMRRLREAVERMHRM